jgi:hypothetical protein
MLILVAGNLDKVGGFDCGGNEMVSTCINFIGVRKICSLLPVPRKCKELLGYSKT